jgi:hypothetical protein
VKLFRAIDSEYLAAGKKDEPHVINVGVWDGKTAYAFHNPDDFLVWLNKARPVTIFAWVARAEFGSLEAWNVLGFDVPSAALDLEAERVQRFKIQRDGGKTTTVLDVQPFFKSLKRGRLEKTAEMLSEYYHDSSLVKVYPTPKTIDKASFGIRMPETEEEWAWYDARVKQDARLTAKAAEFLYTELVPKFIPEPTPQTYYSWGTIARRFFRFPQISPRIGRHVAVKDLHLRIREEGTYAGRSETFSTGAIPPSYYLDVTSLYPVAAVTTDAYRLIDVAPMSRGELAVIGKPEDVHPYGWLRGAFLTTNDLWGLPIRNKERNYYVAGEVAGLYHTLDLIAAGAKIVRLDYGLKPIFTEDADLHHRYANLTLRRIEGSISDPIERMGTKEILNSSTGAVGMFKPQPSVTTNFPAYSTIVAQGHLIMSNVMTMLEPPIHYMDTDSAYTQSKREGHMFDLSDLAGEWSMPVLLDSKGYGEHPLLFRSKHYWLDADNYGTHAVTFEFDDWKEIVRTLPETARVHRQVRGTFRTRSAKAKELEIGRWYHEETVWSLEDLIRAFRSDTKRIRTSYDAYTLAREGRWIGSRSLTPAEFYELTVAEEDENMTAPNRPYEPTYTVEFMKKWIHEYAQSKQDIPWTRM